MFDIKIPSYFSNTTVPQPTSEEVDKVMQQIRRTYPNAAITPKRIKVAIMLNKVCLNNYETMGHYFVETTAIYEEDSKGNLSECFYKFVEKANGNPQKAVNIMGSQLTLFADYAQQIMDTAF
tara:strand:+ start:1038 stop:1403 length:366 start_codon:yes stop_codon:yes gene_type:complete